jgi:hypothetical protein
MPTILNRLRDLVSITNEASYARQASKWLTHKGFIAIECSVSNQDAPDSNPSIMIFVPPEGEKDRELLGTLEIGPDSWKIYSRGMVAHEILSNIALGLLARFHVKIEVESVQGDQLINSR